MAEAKNGMSKTLTRAQRCRWLLERQELTDITFLVGLKRVPIKANKSMLQHASFVFYKMFAHSEKEHNAYEIPDVKVEDFKILLDFFYTGEINRSFKNAESMLEAATLYGAVELIDQCVIKLTNELGQCDCASLLVLSIKTENLQLEKTVIDFICRNASKIFQPSFKFFDFTEEALLKLLPLNRLAVEDELKLFETIVEWGKVQIAKKYPMNRQAIMSAKLLRSVLENLIQHIRFPLIDPSDFSTKVDPTELLTDKEIMAVLLYFNVNPAHRNTYKARMFNTKPRDKALPTEVSPASLNTYVLARCGHKPNSRELT